MYPLQTAFHVHLNNLEISQNTIKNYDTTLNQFFSFLENERNLGGRDTLNQISEVDIRAFFNQQNIALNTFNKKLSHLNQYFLFLIDNNVITHYPTAAIHGQASQKVNTNNWLSYMPTILNNNNLSYYTRVVLLLISHGFNIGEIMSSGFFKIFIQLKFQNSIELDFYHQYISFIHPLQVQQHCQELLLKQRINIAAPRLSLPGLHKYLKADQVNVPFQLKPNQLYRSYIMHELVVHRHLSQSQLSSKLRLSASSLAYYESLINKAAKGEL